MLRVRTTFLLPLLDRVSALVCDVAIRGVGVIVFLALQDQLWSRQRSGVAVFAVAAARRFSHATLQLVPLRLWGVEHVVYFFHSCCWLHANFVPWVEGYHQGRPLQGGGVGVIKKADA